MRWSLPALTWASSFTSALRVASAVGIPSIVNGLCWGALAQAISWARVRARVVFWVLILGLGAFWGYLMLIIAAGM